MKSPNQKIIHIGEQISAPPGRIPTRRWLKKINAIVNAILRAAITRGDSDEVTITAHGLKIQLKDSGGSGGTGNVRFRGEYTNLPGGYSKNDEVKVSIGVNAGGYISLVDNNTDPPWNSSKWMQTYNNHILGTWT